MVDDDKPLGDNYRLRRWSGHKMPDRPLFRQPTAGQQVEWDLLSKVSMARARLAKAHAALDEYRKEKTDE